MGMTLQPADAYQRAAALMGDAITALTDQQWDLPCGPDQLSIAAAVAWVVVGDSQISAAVDRGRLDEIHEVEANVLGPNLVATWRGTALAAITSLKSVRDLGEPVEHPNGLLAIGDLVGQRVSENIVRSWDIGRAVDREVVIPDDLAEWCLEFWTSHADAVMAGGVLPNDPVQPAADADAPTRLLAFTGRTP